MTRKCIYPRIKLTSEIPSDPMLAYHRAFVLKLQSYPAYFNYKVADWHYALSYFGNSCAICGLQFGEGGKGLAMDHWLNWKAHPHIGTIPRNIVPMCIPCNSGKHNRSGKQWVLKKYPPIKARLILARIEQYFESAREVPAVDRETGQFISE